MMEESKEMSNPGQILPLLLSNVFLKDKQSDNS